LWKNFVAASTWKDIQANRNFIQCFPQAGFQLAADKTVFDTRIIAEFQEPEPNEERLIDVDIDAEIEDENEFSSQEEDDALNSLQLFYVEKMTGNVYTEFYDDGAVKSKVEIKNGIRNGKYKEFYPNGKLKTYGKYKNNQKHRIWHYYDENEGLLRKEKWQKGVLVK
jgi:hypothetical protein